MSKRVYENEEDEAHSKEISLMQMQQQMRNILGDETAVLYFGYLKDWLRGRREQEEFDSYGLMLVPKNRTCLHTEFFLSFLNFCEIGLEASNFATDNPVSSSIWTGRIQEQSLELNQGFQALQGKKQTVSEGLRLLPSKGQVKGRLLLDAWQGGLKGVSEEAVDLIVSTAKLVAMNILEASLRLKRNHLITESGATYSYGVTNRRGAKAVPRVLLPAQEPVSVRDIMEAVEIEHGLISNHKMRKRLLNALKVLASKCMWYCIKKHGVGAPLVKNHSTPDFVCLKVIDANVC
ncbi:unnamed protein product [Enterobius vermicularis]|uniref:DUF4806 domain-containing protein n=1 Tax=Enterobius vermicularis TaxID=51028 RepID=A0A0N4UVU1_ENTVE|nr:unnamed protein product [Enterobius vermicularis]